MTDDEGDDAERAGPDGTEQADADDGRFDWARGRGDSANGGPTADGSAAGETDPIRAVARRRLSVGDRAVVAKYLPFVLVAFLLLAAGGGYLAYDAQTAPDTRTETVPVGSWTVEGGFDHGAEVVNGTSVFPTGTQLENRSLYFTRLAPTLDGEYAVTHRGDAGNVTGIVELQLVTEAVDESGGDDGEPTVYWRETETLATSEIDGLDPGDTHRVAFEVDTAAVNGRIDAIEQSLGASPGTTRVSVVARTDLAAEVVDQRFVDERTDRLNIEPGGGTYGVERDVSASETYDATRTEQVPVEPSPLALYGGPMLFVVGFAGAALTGTAMRRESFTVRDTERAKLEYDRTRSDLDEWISAGTLPEASGERTVVKLDSLRDLVNVAIDSDRRVVERPDARPRFVVLDDDVRYVFDPPAAVTGDGRSAAEDAGETGPQRDARDPRSAENEGPRSTDRRS